MENQTCKICNVTKILSDFAKDKRWTNGYSRQCKECRNKIAREKWPTDTKRKTSNKNWREENRERAREISRISAQKRRANPEIAEYHRLREQNLRKKAIAALGGKCAGCGVTERLAFDHVNDDGVEHRKVEAANTMIRRIANTGKNDSKWEIQLLCPNCHWDKTWGEKKRIIE